MTSIQDRVENGVKFLNEKFPNGWKHLVDVRILNFSHENYCVVSQINKPKYFTQTITE